MKTSDSKVRRWFNVPKDESYPFLLSVRKQFVQTFNFCFLPL